MKRIFTVIMVLFGLSACAGNSWNPPAILLPVLVPVAIVDRIRHPPAPHVYAPTVGGDSIGDAFVLRGAMTAEALRSDETYFYWTDRDYHIPGSARGYFVAAASPRKIEGVVFRDDSSGKESTYYFDVTDVHLIEGPTNEASQPTGTSGAAGALAGRR